MARSTSGSSFAEHGPGAGSGFGELSWHGSAFADRPGPGAHSRFRRRACRKGSPPPLGAEKSALAAEATLAINCSRRNVHSSHVGTPAQLPRQDRRVWPNWQGTPSIRMKIAKATRATLADVARLASVSLGSASRALSVPGELKPPTLARALQGGAARHPAVRSAAQVRDFRMRPFSFDLVPIVGRPPRVTPLAEL